MSKFIVIFLVLIINCFCQGALNVKDAPYSAIGDGVAYDRSAIQHALDHAYLSGGGEVLIPPGRYRLDSSLVISDYVTIKGEGPASVLQSEGWLAIENNQWGATGTNWNYGCGVRDLSVDCAAGRNGVSFGGVSGGNINNVTVIAPNGYGIWLLRGGENASRPDGFPTKQTVVSGCHVTGVGDVGIELWGAISCSITANTVTGTGGISGFLAWGGAQDNTFVANTAQGDPGQTAFRGFQVMPLELASPSRSQTARNQFIGNTVRNAFIGFKVSGIISNQSSGSIFRANSIYNCEVGVDLCFNSGTVVTGNMIEKCSLPLRVWDIAAFGHPPGSNPYDNVKRLVFDNNTVNGGSSCLIYGNKDGSFSGNQFHDMTGTCLILWGVRDCQINGNLFSGKPNLGWAISQSSLRAFPSTNNILANNLASPK